MARNDWTNDSEKSYVSWKELDRRKDAVDKLVLSNKLTRREWEDKVMVLRKIAEEHNYHIEW